MRSYSAVSLAISRGVAWRDQFQNTVVPIRIQSLAHQAFRP